VLRSIEYWQKDLEKTAKKLILRMVQKRWSESSFFNLEKELFNGFFAVRKLIETGEIPNHIHSKKYELVEYPISTKISDLKNTSNSEGFSIKKGIKVKLTAKEISNQFIHSYYFMPMRPDGLMFGFLICSDYKRESGIYMLTTFDVIELFRCIAGKNGLID
tara:strand:+ start:3211 stop:3693 length:483 start_codon:yes stop_codon:yes gene_type:complete